MNDSGMPESKALQNAALKSLGDGKARTVDEIVSESVRILGLPETIYGIESRIRGKSEIKYRIEWSLTSLRNRGLVDMPREKYRIITDLGKKALSENADVSAYPVLKESNTSADDAEENWGPEGYDPGIDTEGWLELLKNDETFTPDSLDLVRKIASLGGDATCKLLSVKFGKEPGAYNGIAVALAKRIHDRTGCPLYSENGKESYWPILFLGRKAEPEDGKYEWRLRPELAEALERLDSGTGQTVSFFDYLSEKGLDFDTETVEDFLLSLKAKQFVILSGGTGTGKTKLAQAYGEYLSKTKQPVKVESEVKLGESAKNLGFTVSKDKFFEALPSEARRLDGKYRIEIAGVQTVGEIQMTPRLWLRNAENREEIVKAIQDLKGRNEDDKATLTIWMPGSESGDRSYEIVPVGSNWTDNRYIVGYRNAISGKYAGTPSLDLMIRAGRDFVHPHLLILDEMNLSHVERYFSDVISCMESGEPIRLDSDGNMPESVSMGANLFVIGTVNMDETTYMFSPKVLDRANVIEFEPASVSRFLRSGLAEYRPKGDAEFLQDCMKGVECRSMGARDIVSEIESHDRGAMDALTSDLESIQTVMIGMKLPFGYRTLDEFMRFMYVAWVYRGKDEFTDWRRFADSQIKQRILPKIHGNSAIMNGLRDLLKICRDGGYPRSAAKLERMISVLESQRYVSFNC